MLTIANKFIFLGFLISVFTGCSQRYNHLTSAADSPIKVFIGEKDSSGKNPVLISSPSKLSSGDVCKIDSQDKCEANTKVGLSFNKEQTNGRFIYELGELLPIAKTDRYLINTNSIAGEKLSRILSFDGSKSGPSITWKAVLLSGLFSSNRGPKILDDARVKVGELIQAKGVLNNHITHLSKNPSLTGRGGISVASADNFKRSIEDLELGANDGCFIYMTTGGSVDGFFLGSDEKISGARLAKILDDTCGDRPTVVILSSSHSGLLLTDTIKKSNRIVLTSTAGDKTQSTPTASSKYGSWDTCFIESFSGAKTWKELEQTTSSCISKANTAHNPQKYFGSQLANTKIFGDVNSTNPNKTPEDNNKLEADKNIKLTGANGQTDLLTIAKGKRYLFVDFSSSTCGVCIRLSQTMVSNPDILGSKCASATIVEKDGLRAWVSVAGQGAEAHSYEVESSISQVASKLKIDERGATPVLAVLDMNNNGAIVQQQEGANADAASMRAYLSVCR